MMPAILCALAVTGFFTSGMIIRYWPFRSMVCPRRKRLLRRIYIAACLLNTVIAAVFFSIRGLDTLVSYLHTGGSLFAIALTVVNILILPGHFGEHIFTLGITRTLHFLMLSIPAYILSLQPELTPAARLIQLLGLYGLLILLSHNLLQKMLCRTVAPFLELETQGYWNTIFFIPIAFFVAAAILIWGSDGVDPLLQMISSLSSGTMLVLMCWSIGADHRRMKRYQDMAHQLDVQKVHYGELTARVENARKLNHNLKHHIAAIRGFMDSDDREGLSRYCDELSARVGSSASVPYTGNSAVDGVLYHAMQQAEQEQIAFKLTGTIRAPGIEDIDLCAALGNALDNAIAGCKTVPENRHIAVLCQSEKALLTIVVRNSFDGVVQESKDGILSRKQAGRVGVGLASMDAFCQRYGGTFQRSWDESTFTVMLLLPLSE